MELSQSVLNFDDGIQQNMYLSNVLLDLAGQTVGK